MVAALQLRRLAGIRFEDRTPPAPTALPRMDIAVFVGFASTGPLHTPVPVESVATFADVFGPELALARDGVTGRVRHAHLAPTVRAFFANGGRRCWVVRVADERRAERSRASLPGVLRRREARSPEPALAVARSVGAHFDGLRVRAFLSTVSVGILSLGELDGVSRGPLTFSGAGGSKVRPGDLLRLRSRVAGERRWVGFVPMGKGAAPSWFLGVGAPLSSRSSEVVVKLFRPDTERGTATATWIERAAPGRIRAWPSEGTSGAEPRLELELELDEEPEALVGQWLQVGHQDGRMWLFVRSAHSETPGASRVARVDGDAWWEGLSPPPSLLRDPKAWLADIVSMDLELVEEGAEPRRIAGLGLTPRHARGWMELPTDEVVFTRGGSNLSQEARAFQLEVSAPRVALAGGGGDAAGDVFLPLGLDELGAPGRVWHSARTALEREGLEQFGPALFLHEALAGSTLDSLGADADLLRFGLGEGSPPVALRGLHAAWAIEEASLVAVPDALHNGWSLSAAQPEALPPQALARAVPEAETFTECERRIPNAPSLQVAVEPDALGTYTLRWTHGEEPRIWFVLEESRRPDFSDPMTFWLPTTGGAQGSRVIRGRAPGTYYYRVLALTTPGDERAPGADAGLEAARAFWASTATRGAEAVDSPCTFTGIEGSDWSNGVMVRIAARGAEWEERESKTYDASTWVAVSRALARLCAARADALALLALPGHAREEETLALEAELRAESGAAVAIGDTGVSLPLGAREAAAWGFTAIYHPWLTAPAEDGTWSSVPALGALAGAFAARARARGAWVAPANQPLTGATALEPPIARERLQELLERRINVVRTQPSGLLVLSQDTLASDVEGAASELRPVNVRRLMILLRRLVLRIGERFVFEPNDERLRARVRHSLESALAQLQARGAFAGRTARESYRVDCSDALNPSYGLEAGRLLVEVKVAPSRPLSFLTIRLMQLGDESRVLEIA